jgi:hypothetical protein
MGRVEEIADAIDRLDPEDFRRVALWIRERAQQRWDEQLDHDSDSGKLDVLFDEADRQSQAAATEHLTR